MAFLERTRGEETAGGKRENGRKKKFHRLSRPLWSSVIVSSPVSISGSAAPHHRGRPANLYARNESPRAFEIRACAGSDYEHANARLFPGQRITPRRAFTPLRRSIDRFEENRSVEPSQILRTATSRLSRDNWFTIPLHDRGAGRFNRLSREFDRPCW